MAFRRLESLRHSFRKTLISTRLLFPDLSKRESRAETQKRRENRERSSPRLWAMEMTPGEDRMSFLLKEQENAG
jgi:hypothetical protein